MGEGNQNRVVREGAVLEADVRDRRFELWMNDAESCTVAYPEEDEPLVTTALHAHKTMRLRVEGMGHFGADGALAEITDVTELTQAPSDAEVAARTRALMEKLLHMGEAVPEDAFADLPTDGASRLDYYLYGDGRR